MGEILPRRGKKKPGLRSWAGHRFSGTFHVCGRIWGTKHAGGREVLFFISYCNLKLTIIKFPPVQFVTDVYGSFLGEFLAKAQSSTTNYTGWDLYQ